MQSLQLGVEDPSFFWGMMKKTTPFLTGGKSEKFFSGPTKKGFLLGEDWKCFQKKLHVIVAKIIF